MSSQSQYLTIFFADIGGSTALYQSVGDERATELVAEALNGMGNLLSDHNGTLLRTVGDEVLAIFPNPFDAAGCAIAMERWFVHQPLSIRVGFHHGEAIPRDGDVYGNAVNLAARLTALAKVGEVVTSHDTVSLLTDEQIAMLGCSAEVLTSVTFKGMSEETDVYRLIWQQTVMTGMQMRTAMATGPGQVLIPSLHLDYGEQKMILREGKYSIGRSPGCDIQVDVATASRHHATIEFKNDKFWFTDESSNGSFYCRDDDSPLRLLRETSILTGRGRLGIGFLPASGDDSDGVVSYAVLADLIDRT